MLEIPYEERDIASAHKARYFTGYGWIYTGSSLPEPLRYYHPDRYSWTEWVQDELNKTAPTPNPNPDPSTGTITLRADQQQDVRSIITAHHAGAPGFLLANDVGTGKTPVAIAAVKNLPNVRNVLVICPLGVIPGWRDHLQRMGDGGKRWAIINYESSKKLLEPPASARAAKRTRTKNQRTARYGRAKVQWDVVISDESHARANPESQQSLTIARVVAGLQNRPAFEVNISATAGSDPVQLSYLHRGIAWRTGQPLRSVITPDNYMEWCKQYGIKVTPGRYGNKLMWERNQADLKKMHTILFKGDPVWGVRRTPPWDEPQRIPLPVALTPAERHAYEQEWSHFKAAMDHLETLREKATGAKGTKPAEALATAKAKGWAAQTRYRQKVGQIKARGNALFAKELLNKGLQVAISCIYIGTVDALRDELTSLGIETAEFTGQNRETREHERQAFQRGEKPVIIFTPPAGVNLQASDEGVPDSTSNPRATIVAEPRWSPKGTLQVEGRCHRNHQLAPVYYSYAENTVDHKVITTAIEGVKDTKTLMGDSTKHFVGLSKALGVPLLLEE